MYALSRGPITCWPSHLVIDLMTCTFLSRPFSVWPMSTNGVASPPSCSILLTSCRLAIIFGVKPFSTVAFHSRMVDTSAASALIHSQIFGAMLGSSVQSRPTERLRSTHSDRLKLCSKVSCCSRRASSVSSPFSLTRNIVRLNEP